MNRSFTLLFAVLVSLCGCASTREPSADDEAVLATTRSFIGAMRARDPEAVSRTVLPDGVIVFVRLGDGKREEMHFTQREWVERFPSQHAELLKGFTGEMTVRFDGDVAVVWAGYSLDGDDDDESNFTGADVFDLVLTDAGWRVSGGAYNAHPLAPPASATPARN